MRVEVVGPLVIVTDVGESFQVEGARHVTEALQQFLDDGRFLMLIDGQGLKGFSAEARHHFGTHRRTHQSAVERAELGVIVVSTSSLLRGALAAISWISGAFRQLHVFSTPVDAVGKVQALLAHHGVAVTPEMEAALAAFLVTARRR